MTYFKSYVFDGRKTARKALDKIEDNDNSYIWMDEGDVAEISVNDNGNYRVHSTWAQDPLVVRSPLDGMRTKGDVTAPSTKSS